MESTNQNDPPRTASSSATNESDDIQVVEATLEQRRADPQEDDDLEAGIPVIRLSTHSMVENSADSRTSGVRQTCTSSRSEQVSAFVLGDNDILTAAAAQAAADEDTSSDVDVDDVGLSIAVHSITPLPIEEAHARPNRGRFSEGVDSSESESSDSSQLQLCESTSRRRAEFLSATIFKTTSAMPLGLGLFTKEGAIMIASIKPNSISSQTPFQVGDRLLSINHKRCYQTDSHDMEEFLARIVGKVTMVVHNAGGDPNYVETMVTRMSLDDRCGLGLQSSGPSHLRISSIHSGGLFFDSLLNVGDPVVSINGMPTGDGCDAQGAADIIVEQSGKYITIVARTMRDTGVVVAAYSTASTRATEVAGIRDIMAVAEALHAGKNEPSRVLVVALAVAALLVIAILLWTNMF